ncbi:CatB-related O-acetyltransferase [Niallia circulans]|uniref:CatB-related O-acetyltransferase n=1 Tax=Niallia circulans TaxID=1397 RepID=UPI002E25A850
MNHDDLIMLHDYIKKNVQERQIVVFGTGSGAIKFSANLKLISKEVFYYLDNDSSKWNCTFLNKPIYPPKFISEENLDNLYIFIASASYKVISEQLINMGLIEGKHYSRYPLSKQNPEIKDYQQVINGVKIGKFTYGYLKHCSYDRGVLKKIGAFCSINETAIIGVINHPIDLITTHPILYVEESIIGREVRGPIMNGNVNPIDILSIEKNQPIIIGNDVWIGANAVILPDVNIGNGAVIGAGAVVTKDVPDYAVVVGVPAKVLKYRFTHQQIEILNKVRWWDWPNDKIEANMDLLMNPTEFFEKHSKEIKK